MTGSKVRKLSEKGIDSQEAPSPGNMTEKMKLTSKMKGYRVALTKRSELPGTAFDLWAFENASSSTTFDAAAPRTASTWALSPSTGTYRQNFGNVELSLSVSCYERLRKLHVGNGVFSTDLDALALRYAPLHKGLQAGCPEAVFVVMKDLWDVDTECFASPFNCRLARFCSAFPEVDTAFGSLGSFFDYCPTSGSFEVNPPFIEEVIVKAHAHMERLLRGVCLKWFFMKFFFFFLISLPDSTGPMMFIVIVPRWQGKKCWQNLTASKWISRTCRLRIEDHHFARGEAGAKNGFDETATNETSVLFLQNDQAKEKWPLEDRDVHRLKVAFGMTAKKKPKKKDQKQEPQKKESILHQSSGKSNWEKLQSAKKRPKPK